MDESVTTTELESVDWEALEAAVERNSSHSESYLNRSTGLVLTVVQGEPEAKAIKEKISNEIQNYIRVEAASSREQYKWMERFVGSVVDDALRERLLISIDGKGAFRRFKDVLLAFPVERERWFNYRSNLLHWHIQQWFERNQLVIKSDSPWGEIDEPEELPLLQEKDLPGAELPGEALRREARELIDQIAAIDLPTALAFLEFLKEKGSKDLGIDSIHKAKETLKVSNG